MKTEKNQNLKEVGATVDRNQNKQMDMIGSDGRWYRFRYHKESALEALEPGQVVRVWIDEPEPNRYEVIAVERF